MNGNPVNIPLTPPFVIAAPYDFAEILVSTSATAALRSASLVPSPLMMPATRSRARETASKSPAVLFSSSAMIPEGRLAVAVIARCVPVRRRRVCHKPVEFHGIGVTLRKCFPDVRKLCDGLQPTGEPNPCCIARMREVLVCFQLCQVLDQRGSSPKKRLLVSLRSRHYWQQDCRALGQGPLQFPVQNSIRGFGRLLGDRVEQF